MIHTQVENDTPIYSEERPLIREKYKFISRGLFTILFVFLIVYAGSLHSGYLALIALLLFGLLLYPGVIALILGFTGIHNLKVFESGFIPPYCAALKVNLQDKGFISWKNVEAIYSNKNLRVSKIYPYLAVSLGNTIFAIPDYQIININLFLSSVKPFTEIIVSKEFKPGRFPIYYYPPSHEARLDNDAIVLNYGDREERFNFPDIKRIVIKMSHQLILKDGKRIGLLGMGREDVIRIKEMHQKFNSDPRSDSEKSSIDGLLKSSIDDE